MASPTMNFDFIIPTSRFGADASLLRRLRVSRTYEQHASGTLTCWSRHRNQRAAPGGVAEQVPATVPRNGARPAEAAGCDLRHVPRPGLHVERPGRVEQVGIRRGTADLALRQRGAPPAAAV